MGCRILEIKGGGAVLHCSTVGYAFGPTMESEEEAQAFLDFLAPADPRNFMHRDLMAKYADFRKDAACDYCGKFMEGFKEPGAARLGCSRDCKAALAKMKGGR